MVPKCLILLKNFISFKCCCYRKVELVLFFHYKKIHANTTIKDFIIGQNIVSLNFFLLIDSNSAGVFINPQ